MAYQSLYELKEIVKDYLQEVMNDTKGDMVRESYQPNSQPFQNAKQDVCYFTVLPADDAINRQMDIRYDAFHEEEAKKVCSYTRVIALMLSFYGPNAYENAVNLRMEVVSGSRDNLLAVNGLHLILDIAEPLLTYELYQNQWIPRVDLSMKFNNRVTDDSQTVAYIKSASIQVVEEKQERILNTKGGN